MTVMSQPVKGPIERFHEEHGPDFVKDGNWIYYPDGCKRENTQMGLMVHGYHDPVEQAKAIIHFHQLKLKREIRAFDDIKQSAMYSSSPSDADVERLRQLQQTVLQRKETIAKAQEQLEQAKRAPRIKEVEGYIVKHRTALAVAKSNWREAEANGADSDELDILERDITKAESTLLRSCVWLIQAGGVLPKGLKRYEQEAKSRAEALANQSMVAAQQQAARSAEIRNIEV